jgi:hypothetical protein
MKPYIRIEIGSDGFTPGTGTVLEDSNTILSCTNAHYPKNFGESISSINIFFTKNTTTADDSILGPGKEIQIYNNDSIPVGYSLGNRIFRGYVISKEVSGSQIKIIANDVFVKTMWTTGSTTQDYDSTTSIKTVLTALCSAAGLTASNNAATPTPENIEKFYSNEQNVFERISYLLNLIGWYGYYDPTTTQTINFQPKSAGSSITFDSTNILDKPDWNNDSSNLINDVILVGGSDNIVDKIYSVATTGSKGYLISGLSYVSIENVTVSLNSDLSDPWPINEYTIVGPSSPGIWFTKETQPTVGYTLYIRYTYQTSVYDTPSTASNASSQSAYIKRSKVIRRSDTVNTDDLDSWANNLVDVTNTAPFWEVPIQEVSFSVLDSTNVTLGAKSDVTDDITGRSLTYAANGSIVYTITSSWPSPLTKILISTKPLKNPMQQTTIQDSIEKTQLELNKINPTSLVRKDGSTPILGSQDFAGYELRNVRLENSEVAPDNLDCGGIYFDTSGSVVKVNLGTAASSIWTNIVMGSGSYLPLAAGSSSPLTGSLYINKTTPILYCQESGDTKMLIGWQNGNGGAINNLSGPLTIIQNGADNITFSVTSGKKFKFTIG